MKIHKILLIVLMTSFLSPIDIRAQVNFEPVILVPGIMGSWSNDVMFNNSTSGTWNFFPIDHAWDNMIDALEDMGYEKDKTLFVAFYDWRQSNINSATDFLIPTIDKALANSSTGKINIIAHSMGGLVSRRYIQSNNYRGDVNQLIMLGTPNYGSSDVYTLWEGGMVPDNWSTGQRLGISFYLWYLTTTTAQFTDNYDTIHTFIPSIRELLPTYDFLVDSGSGTKLYSSLADATNPFLENLNLSENMSNLRELGHITVIAGKGEGTVSTIPVVDRSSTENKLWTDGMPEPINPIRNNTEGDNRVLLSSAFLDEFALIGPVLSQENRNFWQKIFAMFIPHAQAQSEEWDIDERLTQLEINSNHGGLPTVAIPEVFAALGLSNPVGDFEPPTEPSNITSFWLASPVAVKITDPQGRVITKDSNQIPEAIYTGESDPNGVKMVIIPNALSGQYEIELVGTEDGEYHMGISTFTDVSDSTVTVEKNILTGEKVEYTTFINNETGVVEEVSEPVITLPDTEQSVFDLTKALIDDLDKYYADGKITSKGIYQSLLNKLKIALVALKEAEITRKAGEKYPKLHELKVKLVLKLAEIKLIDFVSEVEKQATKNKIDVVAANDLKTQAESIISKID